MLPWQRQIRQLFYQQTDVCVVNLLSAIFGDQRIKGLKEKGERNTFTVFSHLKMASREGSRVGQKKSYRSSFI